MIDTVRADDHTMNDRAEPAGLLAHARRAERVHGRVGKGQRPGLSTTIAETYQLAGWMSLDHGRAAIAERRESPNAAAPRPPAGAVDALDTQLGVPARTSRRTAGWPGRTRPELPDPGP